MKFDDFEAGFVRLNRRLWVILLIVVVMAAAVFTLIWQRRTFLVYQGGEIFKERLLAVDVCKEGFMSIINGEPNPLFVSSGILELLKKEPFVLNDAKLLVLKSIDENKCRIVVKSSRVQSYVINLLSQNDFPFYYKVHGVIEVENKEVKHDI